MRNFPVLDAFDRTICPNKLDFESAHFTQTLIQPGSIMSRIFLILTLISALAMGADKTRIAILNIEAKPGVDPNAAATLTDLLGSELVSLQRFDVVDRKNMEALMKEQSLQQSGCSDQACAVKLGNILNVQKMVVGSLSKLGTKYLITVSFVNVEKSQVELSDKITADNEDGLFAAVQTLAKKITAKVGLSGRIVQIKDDGSILVNLGKDDNISLGQTLALTRPGKAIVDPSTGDFLGREVTELGNAKIASFIGGQLSTIRLENKADLKALKQGDRVSIEGVAGAPSPVTDSRTTRTAPSSGGGGNGGKIFFGVTGTVLALGGAGSFIASFPLAGAADNARTAYTNAKTGDATSFGKLYTQYENAAALVNVTRIAGIAAFGLGATSIVIAILLPNNRTGLLLPTYDGERVALQYYKTF